MVSTVTVTTVTTIAAMGLTASLSIFAVILLICFLTSRELLMASNSETKKFFGRTLNIGIIPLLLAFTVIVALKIAEILA